MDPNEYSYLDDVPFSVRRNLQHLQSPTPSHFSRVSDTSSPDQKHGQACGLADHRTLAHFATFLAYCPAHLAVLAWRCIAGSGAGDPNFIAQLSPCFVSSLLPRAGCCLGTHKAPTRSLRGLPIDV